MNKAKYPHLEAAMALRGLSSRELSKALGIAESTLYNKRYGKTDFNRGEIKKIKTVMNLSEDEVDEIFLT